MKLLLSLLLLSPLSRAQEAALLQLRAAAGPAALAAPAAPAPLLGTYPAAVVPGRSPFPGLYTGADKDGDGLEDGFEDLVASEFRPWLVFSRHENATRPGEPLTLYQVRPIGCAGGAEKCPSPLRVKIVYANLWRDDGGYGPSSFFCGGRDTHLGDDQTVTVNLRSNDMGTTFRPETVEIGEFTWPTKSGQVQWWGSHFRLVLSAGKHHHFFDSSWDGRDSPYSNWACADTVDYAGASFLSVLRGNAGEPESHGAGFVNALDGLGFPGEDAWGAAPFCGGVPVSRAECVASPPGRMWSRHAFFKP